MGLAASQARALLIVARKSDIEYRMQCLTQRKMVLAMQTQQIASEYSAKMNNRKLQFVYNIDSSSNETKTEDLSYYSLMVNANYIGQYRVTDAMGRVVVPSYDYIPQQEIEVPVYTKVSTNTDGSYSAVTTNKTVPTATNTALGESSATANNGDKIYPEIYLPSAKSDGSIEYVKIQNSDGTLNTDAKVVDENGTSMNVFSYIGPEGQESSAAKTTANYAMTENLKNWYKYTMATTSSLDQSTDFASAAEAEEAGYVQINGETKKVMVDREPINGKYYTDDGKEYVVASEIANTSYFQNGLRNGALILEKATITDKKDALGNKIGESISWASQSLGGSEVIQDVLDTSDDAAAEAEYETKTAIISAQDKLIDTEIKQLETLHKALETEEDSVKQIIKTNIEKTFATFKA